MSPPALVFLEDVLNQKSCDKDWKDFSVFYEENPNPNINILAKKAALQNNMTVSPILSRPSVKDDSFRMVLPPVMSPPRDNAVPLPLFPEPMTKPWKKLSHQESMISLGKSRSPVKTLYQEDEDFKCNAFCLSLPGFGKMRSPKSEDSIRKKMIRASSFSNSTVSLRASLEKFECGSWASTTTLAHENGRLFFDLPVEEVIKCDGGDVRETVSSGFFFDKETEGRALRSVLKTRSSLSGRQQRVSEETSPQRRVRFSTTTSVSCPNSPRSCITPRLRKARNDFNMFLAAQNA